MEQETEATLPGSSRPVFPSPVEEFKKSVVSRMPGSNLGLAI